MVQLLIFQPLLTLARRSSNIIVTPLSTRFKNTCSFWGAKNLITDVISGCSIKVKIQSYFIGPNLLDPNRPFVQSHNVQSPLAHSPSVQSFQVQGLKFRRPKIKQSKYCLQFPVFPVWQELKCKSNQWGFKLSVKLG